MLDSWPGQSRTIYRDHDRFEKTYFTAYPGMYFSGDGCRRDADGYYWITGRVDDVINVSGHRMGTAEVESALVSHPKVAEAAVVGYPHDLKGQGIYCYITLNSGENGDDDTEERSRLSRSQGDRPDRIARSHSVLSGIAENALGKNHAPHLEEDCRRRLRKSRRYIYPCRPDCRRRIDQQSAEPPRQLSAPCIRDGIQKSDVMPSFSQSP